MPRIRQYEQKYRTEDFRKAVGHRQVELDLNDRELAEAAGMAYTTFWRRMKEPDTMTVGELMALIRVADLPIEAVMDLLGLKKKDVLRLIGGTDRAAEG